MTESRRGQDEPNMLLVSPKQDHCQAESPNGTPTNRYTFALAYYDKVTHFVGVTAVEVLAESPEAAARQLDALKYTEWLKTVPALDILDPEDLDGIFPGEILLMSETMASPERAEVARSLQDQMSYSHNDKHLRHTLVSKGE